MRTVLFFLLFCIPMIVAGCGGSSTDQTELEDNGAIANPDGGEPILAEEGP